MVPWREATTHVLTHTLHYGMGVFEGVRAYKTDQGTAIFRLKEHTDRLFRSAHILGMKMPYDKKTISDAQLAAVRDNKKIEVVVELSDSQTGVDIISVGALTHSAAAADIALDLELVSE